jgi:hypothetical protein
MANADWGTATGSASSSNIISGVSSGIPVASGSFAFGFNSLVTTPGVVALYCAVSTFAPMAKGGDISACIQRGLSGGPTNFAPFIFIGLTAPTTSDSGYLLGLGDGNPSHFILRKGALTGGLPDVAPGTQGVLAQSVNTYAAQTYWQLKLEMVANANGDTIVNCYHSDLTQNPAAAPVWTAIPGMPSFVDDALGINSGSPPYTSGRVGFGMISGDISRRSYFDYIVIDQQL